MRRLATLVFLVVACCLASHAQARRAALPKSATGPRAWQGLRTRPIPSRIEHTSFAPSAGDVLREAEWAAKNQLRAMVTRPEHIGEVTKILLHEGTGTIPVAVIGFPRPLEKFTAVKPKYARQKEGLIAYVPTVAKIRDARQAMRAVKAAGGRQVEMDMIIDLQALKRGDTAAVKRDVLKVARAVEQLGARLGVEGRLKVIIETSVLTDREIELASRIVKETPVFSIKTSTGYGPRAVSVSDLKIMNSVIQGTKLIKASGGITADTIGTLAPYADTFGTSRTRTFPGVHGSDPAPAGASQGY